MLLAAISSPEKLEDAKTKVESGKEKYRSAAEDNNSLYLAEGGMSKQEQSDAAGEEEFDRFKEDFKKNLKETADSLLFKNIRKSAGETQYVSDSDENEENLQDTSEDAAYDSGVVTIYGLNEITFCVKDSNIIINTNISISAKNFGWMGYEKGQHDIVEETYQDWWSTGLDALQLGLDICGFIPGIGTFFDLANAAISLARGDYCGAAMSAIAAIPGLGDACAAAKMGVKAYKAAKATKTLTKGEKAIRVAKVIYNGVRFTDSGIGVVNDMKEIGPRVDFKIENANDAAALVSIVRQLVGMTGNAKNMYSAGKAVKTGQEYVLPSEKKKSKSKESGKKSNSEENKASSKKPHIEGKEQSNKKSTGEGGDSSETPPQEKTTEIIIQRAMQMLLTIRLTLQPEVLWQNMWIWESRIHLDCIL